MGRAGPARLHRQDDRLGVAGRVVVKVDPPVDPPVLAFLLFGLIGCSNPPIVPLGNETYMLAKEDHAGIFGSLSKLKADVISEANAFAGSKGKVAVPIAFREKPVGNSPGDWASVEYQFRLVDPDSPEAQSASLNAERKSVPVRPNASIQSTHSISVDIDEGAPANPAPEAKSKDVYTELLKLEDLRKRGILTDAEFEEEKAKLLRSR